MKKTLHWKIALVSLGFALAACSAVEEPSVVDQSGSSEITLFPERLELSAPINGLTDGSFVLFNSGNEQISYASDVFFTPDLEVASGEQGRLAPGESATVKFRATCTELRLEEDIDGFFIPINIGVATSEREYFPLILTLPLTLRCV